MTIWGWTGRKTAISPKSGPGCLAEGIIGPVAIEPGHAPLHALAEAGKAAILDDGVMHLVHAAVAELDLSAAIAARNVVGLPGPERGFMDLAISNDLQRGIPVVALFFLKLIGNGPERGFAGLYHSVIFGTGQPEIQLPRIGRLGGLAKCQKAEQHAERGKAEFIHGDEQLAHGNPPHHPTPCLSLDA